MGGRAGGGSSSPQLPAYMEDLHEEWVRGNPNVHLPSTKAVTQLLNNKIGDTATNPYSNKYLPTVKIQSKDYYNEMYNKVSGYSDSLTDRLAGSKSDVATHVRESLERTLNGEVNGIIDDVVSHISTLVGTSYRDVINTNYSNILSTVNTTALEKVKSTISTYVAEVVDSIKFNLIDTSKSNVQSVVNMVLANVGSFANKLLSDIVNSVYDVVESTIVSNMVDSFDSASKTRYNREVGK